MKAPAIVTVLAIAIPAVATAQQARNGIILGGGFEAMGVGAAYERAYGLSLQAGVVQQYRRVGIRLVASYFERNRELPSSQFIARPRAFGGSLELSYDLTTTRFRPYLVGGWGLYRLSSTMYQSGRWSVVDQVSPAMIGGLGFRYRVGGVNLFSELRVNGLTNGKNWAAAFIPVTFGVRFE